MINLNKLIDIKNHAIIKSIYDVIDDNISTYIADSTVKTLLAIAFYHTGMNTDINECITKISSEVETALKIHHEIKCFDTFENVLEHYQNNIKYKFFVSACINFIEDVNGKNLI